jgi:hypothetical protein
MHAGEWRSGDGRLVREMDVLKEISGEQRVVAIMISTV